VRPASSDERDEESAKVSTILWQNLSRKSDMTKIVERATHWSELCGTAFYKVCWDGDLGKMIGKSDVREGDVSISVCPPFEIFPDDSACENIKQCSSIIHARAVSKDEAERIWGGEFSDEESVEVYSIGCNPFSRVSGRKTVRQNHVLVLERYQRPSVGFSDGRLSIVAGGRLVFDGSLPYLNEDDGARGLPFIRQACNENPGVFWGTSVIERCIPIQRAYNAVKNRKHEYLFRAACGVLAAEEGAVDTIRLEDEGLEPGGILIYRTGSPIPTYIEPIPLPAALVDEESMLINEFILISGVSELSRQSISPASGISGVALELLAQQDDTRLSVAADHIRNAVAELSCHALRLYRQFAVTPRIERIVGDNGSVGVLMWSASMLGSDDVVFETENELSQSITERRKMTLELLSRGLFSNKEGQLDSYAKTKVLNALGFGQWEDAQDISDLHIEKAKRENIALVCKRNVQVSEIDEHDLHITQHIKHMLTENFEALCKRDKAICPAFLEHIQEHRGMTAPGL